MSKFDIVRAWKDEEYRNSLSAEERAQLPENPAGVIDLCDEELLDVSGAGHTGGPANTAGCCPNTSGWTCTSCVTVSIYLTLTACTIIITI